MASSLSSSVRPNSMNRLTLDSRHVRLTRSHALRAIVAALVVRVARTDRQETQRAAQQRQVVLREVGGETRKHLLGRRSDDRRPGLAVEQADELDASIESAVGHAARARVAYARSSDQPLPCDARSVWRHRSAADPSQRVALRVQSSVRFRPSIPPVSLDIASYRSVEVAQHDPHIPRNSTPLIYKLFGSLVARPLSQLQRRFALVS